jgi:hypothetical protein
MNRLTFIVVAIATVLSSCATSPVTLMMANTEPEHITEVIFTVHTHPSGDDKEPGPIGKVRLVSDLETVAFIEFQEAIRNGKWLIRSAKPLRSNIDWETARHNLHLMVSVEGKDDIDWQANYYVEVKTNRRTFPPMETPYVKFRRGQLTHKLVLHF